MLIGARTAAWAGGGGGGAYAYETQYNIWGGTLHDSTAINPSTVDEIKFTAFAPPASTWQTWGESTGINHPILQNVNGDSGLSFRYWANGTRLDVMYAFSGNNDLIVSYYNISPYTEGIIGEGYIKSTDVLSESATKEVGFFDWELSSTRFFANNAIHIGGTSKNANGIGIGEIYAARNNVKSLHYKSVVDNDGNARMWNVLSNDFVTLDGEGVMTAGPIKTE